MSQSDFRRQLVSLSPFVLSRHESRRFLTIFWILVLALMVSFVLSGASLANLLNATLIATLAMIPCYYWCTGTAPGLPIYPIFSLTYLWTFAFPLIVGHPSVVPYSDEERLAIAGKVCCFLIFGMVAWLAVVRVPSSPPKSFWALNERRVNALFIAVLLMSVTFQHGSQTGSLTILPASLIPIVRAGLLGLNVLGIFVLMFRAGNRELRNETKFIFYLLLLLYGLSLGASLLLVGPLSLGFLSFTGYTLGRRRIPWITLILFLCFVWLLQLGKNDMRAKHWYGRDAGVTSLSGYPGFYTSWVKFGVNRAFRDSSPVEQMSNKEDTSYSLIQRASLIHLALLAQSKLSDELEFLHGRTYTVIPELLIPRILMPSKRSTHAGTRILNVHFGLQTEETMSTYTIGWGLFTEAYANFGWGGIVGFGALIGFIFGGLTRWTVHTPILSGRTLFAIVIMSAAVQAEWTAGVFAATVFQSSAGLILLILVIMNRYSFMKVDPATS